jgi:hypothetical protein
LKSKLSTNHKNARKRVQKQEKKAAKEATKKSNGAKRGMALVIPPTVDSEQSSQSNYDLMRPMVQDSVPAPTKIGPGRQRRASQVQAGMTSKRGCLLHPLSQPQFEACECDNNIRRHPSFLERSRHKGENVGKKRKLVHGG